MNSKRTIIAITAALFFCGSAGAQVGPRSNGITLRAGFWNVSNSVFRFDVSNQNIGEQSFEIGGLIGGWLGYHSRVYENWFFTLDLGALSSIETETLSDVPVTLELNVLMPILFGLRYDLLSLRLANRIQPYLSGGAGPYWQLSLLAEENQALPDSLEIVSGESRMDMGAYLGGGINIMFTSWLGMTFDIRQHFVDFDLKNHNSGMEFGIGFTFRWGDRRELFRVKGTRLIVRDIYPAYHQFYSTYPLALVSVQNTAGFPIEVNVRSQVSPYSSRPNDSGFTEIPRGQTMDLPATAVFGPEVFQVEQRKPAVLEIEVEGRAGSTHRQSVNAQLMIHTRNSWNGQIDKLPFFVTSDEAAIIEQSRRWIGVESNSLDLPAVNNLKEAALVFHGLAELGIQYQTDPNIPFYQDDRVQYAGETIRLRRGDCDDLVVLYASLLESLGIRTAFVEVRDPEKELAHLYLLVDAGVPPDAGDLISSNDKRYIIRDSYPAGNLTATGQADNGGAAERNGTLWIPVETTLLQEGFEAAWKAGALQYLQEAVYRNGLAEGWVQIVDVNRP